MTQEASRSWLAWGANGERVEITRVHVADTEEGPVYKDHRRVLEDGDTRLPLLPAASPYEGGVNPKQKFGQAKPSLGFVPMTVVFEIGAAMEEGAAKYTPYNWRTGPKVLASTYYNATLRHLASWWEGEDIDPDSGLSHVVKAISSLVVLRDAMLRDQMADDRPPTGTEDGWLSEIHRPVLKINPPPT